MIVAGIALLAAALGEAVARLPVDACTALIRGTAPRTPAAQLLAAWWRCAAMLGTGTAAAATVLVLADRAWSWGAAAGAVAVGILPLAAAPVTVAPLLGAPLRVGLLAWCAVRVHDQLGATPAAVVALLAGSAAAAAVSSILGRRAPGEVIGQNVRDTVSVLVASPVMLAVGVVPLLVGLPLAPWELWRYCWRCRTAPAPPPSSAGPPGPAELFVVHLDGVGKTRREPTRVARDLVAALRAALPDARFVTIVLPYSPLQLPLTERPASGRFWRWLRCRAFPVLVGHNILQALVASDARYQQAYGHAVAHAVTIALCGAGYLPGRGDRVAVLGYSGGAVLGVAAADRLAELIGDDPVVISVGGYLDGHRMPRRATVHHVVSGTDHLERLGRAMFPARWAAARRSAWNRALARGAVVPHQVTGLRHIGPRGYLSTVKNAQETSNLSRIVAVMTALLQSDLRR